MSQMRSVRSAMRILLVSLLCSVVLLPATAAAQESREVRADITIRSDEDFTAANGVRTGSGTAEDPYVISGWEVGNLTLKDTGAHVVIEGNLVRGRLTLDWAGRHVHVHGNEVGDLRVNQNVRRTGAATSGVIAHNTFGTVGQLRHWDGEFAENVVGLAPGEDATRDVLDRALMRRAVNLDGFNGAHIRDNVIYGYVEARLHGHHHSSGWDDDSHHHGTDDEMDHSQRYHQLQITGNRIEVGPAARHALVYTDNGHRANDRTATSEENPALNDPHIHHTRVVMSDNELVGAGLRVDVFNASDERHIDTARGLVVLDRNQIRLRQDGLPLWDYKDGIDVGDAVDVDLYIRGNVIEAERREVDPQQLMKRLDGAGISLRWMDDATVRVYDNTVVSRHTGVYAYSFTDSVEWFVDGLATEDVEQDVWWTAVANEPGDRSDDEEEGHGGHDGHGG